MRTIQMTLDEDLLLLVDRAAKKLGTTRSAFTRDALRQAIQFHHARQLEEQHRKGYQRHPVGSSEFAPWEQEQDWGDA